MKFLKNKGRKLRTKEGDKGKKVGYTKSFRFKLSIILILTMLIPLLATNGYSLLKSYKILQKDVYMENLKSANHLKSEVDMVIDNIDFTVDMLSGSKFVQEMNPFLMNTTLDSAVDKNPYISEIYVMDTNGSQLYNSSGRLSNKENKKYFKKALEGNTYYSDVMISETTKKPIVIISKPVKKLGDIVGVISATLDFNKMNQLALKYSPGKSGDSFIVDKSGKVIVHPDEELIEQRYDANNIKPVSEVLKGKTDYTIYTHEGEEKLAAYTPVKDTGWGVIIQLPKKEAFSELQEQRNELIIAMIIAIIFGLIIAYILSIYITRPLKKVTEMMSYAAKGDLTHKITGKIVKGKDEFGQLARGFNDMVDSNKSILGKILSFGKELSNSSENLSEIVEQNSIAMEEVANGTTELASSAEKDSRSTEESTSLVKEVAKGSENVAENAESLNEVVMNTVNVAKKGSEMMAETSSSIEKNFESSKVIDDKMNTLEESTNNVGSIVDMIKDVSEQTNLLALNAAIEAARAGEAGKGFAVVADEIRKLAEDSSHSAEEITKILMMIQKEVKETSNIFKENNKSLVSVVEKTEKTSKQINDIVNNSEEALTAVEEIASVSEEQAAASEEVTSLMDRLLNSINNTASTTQQISASVEEQTASTQQIASMARDLSQMGNELRKMLNQFKID